MRSLFLLLAFALALPAGAQKHPPRKPKAAPALAAPVLVYQRTPCYGRCPAYSATIFADGRVEYDGQRFVPLLGKHTLRLPLATVRELLAEARRIHFSDLKEDYRGTTTDMPASLITVQPAGQPKKAVYAEEGIPAGLQAFIKLLNTRLDPLSQGVKERASE